MTPFPSGPAGDPDLFVVAASSVLAYHRARRTVLDGLRVSELRARVGDGELRSIVDASAVDERLHVWSIRSSPPLVQYWRRIRTGDWLLFFNRGFITIAARAADTVESSELAAAVWGDQEGEDLRFMILFGEVSRVRAPVSKLTEELGARFLGFRRLQDARHELIQSRYGSRAAFVSDAILSTRPGRQGDGRG